MILVVFKTMYKKLKIKIEPKNTKILSEIHMKLVASY